MTSNVTAYDVYGHTVEVATPDGGYDATVYGYGRWLPTAVATRARQSQVVYLDFDGTTPSNPTFRTTTSRTGQYATAARQADGGGELLRQSGGTTQAQGVPDPPAPENVYTVKLALGQTYRVSFWVKRGNASSSQPVEVRISGNGYQSFSAAPLSNGTWKYVEGLYTNPTTGGPNLTITILTTGTGGGEHYVDDLVIAPFEAYVSTFAYEERSGRVTAITDANAVTSFFEYDQAGRLTKVRNQDGQIVQRHQYTVPIVDMAENVSQSAQTTLTAVPQSGVTRYEWNINGSTTSTTSPSHTFTTGGSGWTPVWVKMFDVENRLLASRRDQLYVVPTLSVYLFVDDFGDTFDAYANTTGGSGQFTYTWYERTDPSGSWTQQSGASGNTYNGYCQFAYPAQPYTLYLKVAVLDTQVGGPAKEAYGSAYCTPY